MPEPKQGPASAAPAAETLSAILAEMRKAVVPMICGRPKIEAVSIRDVLQWADRIEAAAEREAHAREQAAADYALKRGEEIHADRCRNCTALERAPGNAAALREALERCNELFRCDDDNKARLCHLALKADEATQAAISAPCRNCDRFATAEEARRAFEEEHSRGIVHNIYTAAFDWLFAPAEGGDHA